MRRTLIELPLYHQDGLPMNKQWAVNYYISRHVTKLQELKKHTSVYVILIHTDELGTLNELNPSVIDKHAPLVKIKFTRPPVPWMKDIKINKLQRKTAKKFGR